MNVRVRLVEVLSAVSSIFVLELGDPGISVFLGRGISRHANYTRESGVCR